MSEVVGANFSAKMLRLIDWSSTLLNFLGERRGSIFEGSVSALCIWLVGVGGFIGRKSVANNYYCKKLGQIPSNYFKMESHTLLCLFG